MNLEKIKTEGIYFRQSDLREDGYYTEDKDGNLIKHKFEVTLKDKMNFLLFNKIPTDPISTSFISFRFYDGKLVIASGGSRGDAVSVAKLAKYSFNREKRATYKIMESSIIVDHGDFIEELEFNNEGVNTSCKLTIKASNKTITKKTYSYISWYQI